jgi:hypothetical protein
MELLKAEKVGEIASNSIKKCRACNQTLELVRTILVHWRYHSLV